MGVPCGVGWAGGGGDGIAIDTQGGNQSKREANAISDTYSQANSGNHRIATPASSVPRLASSRLLSTRVLAASAPSFWLVRAFGAPLRRLRAACGRRRPEYGGGLSGRQEASDIVIMDDNFASIVNAVKWGRCVAGEPSLRPGVFPPPPPLSPPSTHEPPPSKQQPAPNAHSHTLLRACTHPRSSACRFGRDRSASDEGGASDAARRCGQRRAAIPPPPSGRRANVRRAGAGRSVYDNIRRFLQFQMTVNVVALTLCSVGAITGVGTPLTAVQLIWVRPLSPAPRPPRPRVCRRAAAGRIGVAGSESNSIEPPRMRCRPAVRVRVYQIRHHLSPPNGRWVVLRDVARRGCWGFRDPVRYCPARCRPPQRQRPVFSIVACRAAAGLTSRRGGEGGR